MFNPPNDIFKNKDKDIYITTKSVNDDGKNNEITVFSKPFYLGKINYQPLTGANLLSYMSVYGETKNKLVKAFIDLSYKGKIKEFDQAYLYGSNPKDEKVYGQYSNYKVRTIAEQNTKLMIVFEEIIKEGNYGIN